MPPPPYESINEAIRREIRYCPERVTDRHEERLRLVGGVVFLHKMDTFVSDSFAEGTSQNDQQFLPHCVSGSISRVVIPHRDTRSFPPHLRRIDGRAIVLPRRFPHLSTYAGRSLSKQERAIRNKNRRAAECEAARARPRVRKSMQKRRSRGVRN